MNARFRYEKPSYYSNKVLIGAWVEDRSSYIDEEYKHNSVYRENFVPKPSQIDPNLSWDMRLNYEDTNFISQIGRNDHPNYFENFSSTYDLSYNQFPKCFPSYIPRTFRFRTQEYQPMDVFLPSFGNITRWGLQDYKEETWKCNVDDPRLTYSTHYRDTFAAPEAKDYDFKRWAIPLANSSIMNGTNTQLLNLKLRDKPMCNVPPPTTIIEVPREKRCNPITWECPDK